MGGFSPSRVGGKPGTGGGTGLFLAGVYGATYPAGNPGGIISGIAKPIGDEICEEFRKDRHEDHFTDILYANGGLLGWGLVSEPTGVGIGPLCRLGGKLVVAHGDFPFGGFWGGAGGLTGGFARPPAVRGLGRFVSRPLRATGLARTRRLPLGRSGLVSCFTCGLFLLGKRVAEAKLNLSLA